MRWKHLPIVAFDTETTGLMPFGGDRVIEFAAVTLHLGPDGHVSSVKQDSWLVNPGIPIPRRVTEITGISDADVADKPPFEVIAHEVHSLLSHGIVVAHNLPFDLAFLTKEFAFVGLHWPEPIAEVDTVDVSIKHFPDVRGHKLADVCKRLGVSLDNAHRATDDAEACGRCFTELARRHDVKDDLQTMLNWARAIGRPPIEGPLGPDSDGRVVFLGGELEGEPVTEHPLHLAWMTKARERRDGVWRWRYPESTREWIQRWLDVRGSGRARTHPKSFRADDWVLDSCIADERVVT